MSLHPKSSNRLFSFESPRGLRLGQGIHAAKLRNASGRFSFKLRYLALFVVLVGLGLSVAGWGPKSWPVISSLIASKKPLELNASIFPPKYTDLPPIVLAVESGEVQSGRNIDVPAGSTLRVDLPDQDDPPTLEVAGKTIPLKLNGKGRLVASAELESGDSITLHQGWTELASWKTRVIRDAAPRVAFVDPPMTYEHKATRLSYEASDDYGIHSITLRVRPVNGLQTDFVQQGMTVFLSSPKTRHVKEAVIEDLTFLPWAGSPVDLQLEVTDAAGNTATSGKMTVTIPKREFSHPLARALVEERAKLLRQPDDGPTRDEMANIMAGIARETANYGGDPIIFMALRTGAVRLVLDKGGEALPAVSRLIWQAAARIEDTMKDKAQDFLRQAQRDKG